MKRPSRPREKHSSLHDCRQVLRFIHGKGLAIGDKLPSHAELCRELQTCHHTLDIAMKWLMEDGVVERRQRSGTTVRALYPNNPLRTIWRAGIVTPPFDRSHFFPMLAQHLHKHLERRGISDRIYLLSNNAMPSDEVHHRQPEDFSGLGEDIESGMLDAVLSSTRLVTDRLLVCGAPAWDQSAFGVRIDYRRFARDAITELRRRGCRRIGLVSPADIHRLLAAGTRATGSASDIERIVSPPGSKYAHGVCSQLLRRRPSLRPDALIFEDDVTAQAFTMALVQQQAYRPILASLTNLPGPIAFALPVIPFALDTDALAAAAVDITINKLLKPALPEDIRFIAAVPMSGAVTGGVPA